MSEWVFVKEVVRITSQWVTLIGEQWVCDKGQKLEYWRAEKSDSVIVLPIHKGDLLLIRPTFRPGVKRDTLDFPGGRLPDGDFPKSAVFKIMERELGVPASAVLQIQSLNSKKWNVNSSFSNQGLWAFSAVIDDSFMVNEAEIGLRVRADHGGISVLMDKLDCLQCRAVLLEWQRKKVT